MGRGKCKNFLDATRSTNKMCFSVYSLRAIFPLSGLVLALRKASSPPARRRFAARHTVQIVNKWSQVPTIRFLKYTLNLIPNLPRSSLLIVTLPQFFYCSYRDVSWWDDNISLVLHQPGPLLVLRPELEVDAAGRLALLTPQAGH